ncbi:AraC family transcriptional regulator [Flavitalea sp.]|nr:helix-turn-helix domain-containing protein [Flavitalea sp.]
MQLYDIIPALQPYVKVICSMDCDDDADTRHIRVLPDACVELFISYTSTPVAIIGNELYNRSIITFRMSRPMDVQMRKGSGCLAICFHPGMAYKFFHLPMHVFTDTTTVLDNVWKGKASEIEDKLAYACNNDIRVSVIQEYLVQQLAQSRDDRQIAWCLKQAKASTDMLSVKQLTDKTGLSQRHLSRRFQQCIGLSPKEYLRVSRFIKSLQHLKKYPAHSLTAVAYESGYYDQAHFIRDYKTYAGYTPGELAHSQHILY